jgi:outer membrane protein TolC
MSGRTVFNFSLAALLASVFASVGVAQFDPGIGVGNRSVDDPSRRAITPMPREKSTDSQLSGLIPVPIQTFTPALCCLSCTKAEKLSGTWVREMAGYAITATLEGDELKISISQGVGDTMFRVILTTDYMLTKEGLIYGVINGVDVNVKQDPKAMNAIASEQDVTKMVMALQSLVDCPFSFRTRITSAGLMVSHVKIATGEMDSKELDLKELLALLGGMYKQSKDGGVTVSKPRKAALGKVPADPNESSAIAGYALDAGTQHQPVAGTAAGSGAAIGNSTDHQAPPASPLPCGQNQARVLDMDRPARLVTLKECVAIALEQGNGGFQTPKSPGSKLEFQQIQSCSGANTQGILQQRIQLDIKINYMLANVEVAYWNLFAAYHNLYAHEAGLREAYRGYRFTDTRTIVGSDPPGNRDQARVQIERFRRMVIDARGQVLESERQLRCQLGLQSGDGTRLIPSDEPNLTTNTPDFQEAAKEAMDHRPEILQCRQDLKAQQLNLILQKNLCRPDLRFVSPYSIQGLGTRLDGSQSVDAAQTSPGNALTNMAANQYQNWLGMTMPLGFRDVNAYVRDGQLSLARSYAQLRDTELKVLEYLVQQYRNVIQTHGDIGPAQAERQALQIYINKIDTLIQIGKWNPQDFLNYLTVQQQLATAIATEYQAIANYRNALAAFEFAKGTIQKYNNISIEKGLLPLCAQKEDADHLKERTATIKTRVGDTSPPPAGGELPRTPVFLQPPVASSPRESIPAPAPREAYTPRTQPVVPPMTAPTLPPVDPPH